MNEYYEEIEQYIKRNEVNKVARRLEENKDSLTNYWHIGRLLVEAQGGEKRAKYGNELIKKWSEKFSKRYGQGYSYVNMTRFRKFYLTFPILSPVVKVSWSLIMILLPIKDENKRNYYINLCITKQLSKRELEREIKNNTYERLLEKTEILKSFSLLLNIV